MLSLPLYSANWFAEGMLLLIPQYCLATTQSAAVQASLIPQGLSLWDRALRDGLGRALQALKTTGAESYYVYPFSTKSLVSGKPEQPSVLKLEMQASLRPPWPAVLNS